LLLSGVCDATRRAPPTQLRLTVRRGAKQATLTLPIAVAPANAAAEEAAAAGGAAATDAAYRSLGRLLHVAHTRLALSQLQVMTT
jgi:hypothetical protein